MVLLALIISLISSGLSWNTIDLPIIDSGPYNFIFGIDNWEINFPFSGWNTKFPNSPVSLFSGGIADFGLKWGPALPQAKIQIKISVYQLN